MKRTTKRLVEAAAGVAAAAIVEKAIQKASTGTRNQRIRRKAADIGKAVRKGAAATARTAEKRVEDLKVAAKKQVPVVRKKAAKQLEKLARITAP
jgi:hypothetical protein